MITKDMTINELLKIDPIILAVLTKSGMHCIGCASASNETLEEACQVHGIDPELMVAQLNDFLSF